MNPLTVCAVIALILSTLLLISIPLRCIHARIVRPRSHAPRFSALERRVTALATACLLASVLDLVIASPVGARGCSTESTTTENEEVLPLLRWLVVVALPLLHIVFILPSLFTTARTSSSSSSSAATVHDAQERRHTISLRVLGFVVAELLSFAAGAMACWLPFYFVYTGDYTLVGTCFASGHVWSVDWYMDRRVATACSVILVILLLTLFIGLCVAVIYEYLTGSSAQKKKGFRGACYAYLAIALVATTCNLPEPLYRSVNIPAHPSSAITSIVIPSAYRYLSIVALPLHAGLLLIVTLTTFILVEPRALALHACPFSPGVMREDSDADATDTDDNDDDDENTLHAPISLSFYAAPRYEDKYLSILAPSKSQVVPSPPAGIYSSAQHNASGEKLAPLTAASTFNEMRELRRQQEEQYSVQHSHASPPTRQRSLHARFTAIFS
ncbi:uncharacterized protein V1518DRAFT_408142 [Limtongia smithiae]|uniref:uncharacterized protein n=1 Tax=Limtongia smithiae TaxID=1125753 RepID=UPI0034CEB2B1